MNHLLQVGGILQPLYEEARHPEAERERFRLLDEARTPTAANRGGAGGVGRRTSLPALPGSDRHHPRQPARPVPRRLRGDAGEETSTAGITAVEVEAFLAACSVERPSILGERTVVRRATAEALAADLDTLQRVPLVAGLHPFLVGKLSALAEHPDPKVL